MCVFLTKSVPADGINPTNVGGNHFVMKFRFAGRDRTDLISSEDEVCFDLQNGIINNERSLRASFFLRFYKKKYRIKIRFTPNITRFETVDIIKEKKHAKVQSKNFLFDVFSSLATISNTHLGRFFASDKQVGA